MAGLVELARFPNAMEAMMVKGVLDAAGIGSVIFDHGMNVADSSGWLVPTRVMVLAEDIDAARAELPIL